MIVKMVYSVVFWLSAFHPCRTKKLQLNPRELITGSGLDYQRHCKYEFGTYVQIHEDTYNTMRPRTFGLIALRPTRNEQGRHFFLLITTGRRLNQLHLTEFPMSDHVIDQLNRLVQQNTAG